jgi:hypothetical protein
VSSNLTYAYVAGTPEAIRRAWMRYERKALGDGSPGATRFIPAMGGCFIVLMVQPSQSQLWPQLERLIGNKPRSVSESDLHAFKEAFESAGRASYPYRSWHS